MRPVAHSTPAAGSRAAGGHPSHRRKASVGAGLRDTPQGHANAGYSGKPAAPGHAPENPRVPSAQILRTQGPP